MYGLSDHLNDMFDTRLSAVRHGCSRSSTAPWTSRRPAPCVGSAVARRSSSLIVPANGRCTAAEWQALRFAWRICAHVKSNTIVFTSAAPVPDRFELRRTGRERGRLERTSR